MTETVTNDEPNSASSASGFRGASVPTGDQGASVPTGNQGAATASGFQGRVQGAVGNALFLCERNDKYKIVAVWAGIVGQDGIKPDTFYMLRDGKPVEVQE